jgi:cytochrome c-type biogenesis protein CcmH
MIRVLGFLVLLALPLASAFAISDPAEMLPDPKEEARAEAIGRQLRCLVCQNESIEDSGADLARDLRQVVRQHVAAGEKDQEIITWMVSRYGDFVRLRPPFEPLTWLLWASPALALGGGVLFVAFAARQKRPAPAPLSPAEQRKLKDLLKS